MQSVNLGYMNPGQAERIYKRRRELKLSQTALAEAVDVSRVTVTKWESNDDVQITGNNLHRLADVLGVTPTYILKGEGPVSNEIQEQQASYEQATVGTEEFCFVPKVSGLVLSAGPGLQAWEHEVIDHSHAFTKSWMRSKGLNPAKTRVISVKGDSMAPYVLDGDVVLVNLEQNRIRSGEIFAINVDGECRIKRIIRRADGAVELRSDNESPQYPTEILRGPDLDKLQIMGMVVWRGG